MAAATMLGLFCLSSLFTMKVSVLQNDSTLKLDQTQDVVPNLPLSATMKNNVPGECVLPAYHDPNGTFWMVLKLPESLSKRSSMHEVTTGGTG